MYITDMRKIFIGDIHSCYQELKVLVEDELKPTEQDTIVFLGDLIDKGPFPLETVDYINLLKSVFHVKVVLGNHDKKLLNKIRNERETSWQVSDQAKELFRTSKLFYRFPEIGVFACHGGLYPDLYRKLGGYLDDDDATFPHSDKKREAIVEKLAHTRMVSPEGKMITLGQEQAEDVHWTDCYDGTEGFVFYGHDAEPEVILKKKSCGIDTGCVYGWKLTAAIVTHPNIIPQDWKILENLSFAEVKAQRPYRFRTDR